jgi:hypothetical protein
LGRFIVDFEACIAHLRFSVAHRRAIRITNLLGRLFVEERRHLKIISNAFRERAILKLMFGALIRATERSKSIKITELERRQLSAVKNELDRRKDHLTGNPLLGAGAVHHIKINICAKQQIGLPSDHLSGALRWPRGRKDCYAVML